MAAGGRHRLEEITLTISRYLAVAAGIAVLVLVAYLWRRRRNHRGAGA